MLDLLPISLGTDGITIRTVNVKQKEHHMQKYLNDVFSEDHDGLLNNVEITFIGKADPSNPERREEFWKTILRTLAPLGLNIEE